MYLDIRTYTNYIDYRNDVKKKKEQCEYDHGLYIFNMIYLKILHGIIFAVYSQDNVLTLAKNMFRGGLH